MQVVRYVIIIITCFNISISSAAVTIDSVLTQSSSCTNNGIATVFASSNISGGLLYALVAGPSTSPLQNSNVFASLFPGTYSLRVYNNNFDSTDTQFTINGNYQLPAFTVTGVNPTCPGSADGSILVLPDTTSGLQPFLFEIISPVIVPQQSSPYFPNLSDNSYEVRITDACGNYQTRTSVLQNNGTGIGGNYNSYIVPSILKIGCDTIEISTYVYIYNEKAHLPYTVTYNTSVGTIVKPAFLIPIDTFNYNPGIYKIQDTIPGLTYGNFCQFNIADVCGVTVSSIINTIAPYDFEVLFSATTVNCVASYTGSVNLKYYPYYPYDYTYQNWPCYLTLTHIATNTIVDSCYSAQPFQGLVMGMHTPGETYHIKVTDGCGEIWEQDIVWPTPGTPEVNVYNSVGCIDSTATLYFQYLNFQSLATLTILSGPANASSSKHHYEYSDTIIYPQSFIGYISGSFTIKDFPAGNYTYVVSDSCGNTIYGSYVVEDYMVSNLAYSWYVKPSCLNNNTLYYEFLIGTAMAVYASVTNLATNQEIVIPLSYALDSLATLSIGTYALQIDYGTHNGNGSYFDGGLVHNVTSCWVLRDTITISPYANNYFITDNTIFCNGDYYVELIVDSSRGVPPYKYSIISGPQTFPLQDSAFFQINSFGNYVISMEDACGNSYIQQISVTSDSFPPIIKNGYFCEGNTAVLSAHPSVYSTYIWQFPDGSTIIGDSIIFQPFSASDTGLYQILNITTINGCTDTLFSEFYLSGKDSINQAFSICTGDSIVVGNNIYTNPGIYRDTLSTSSGCDSLIITSINQAPMLIDSNYVSICNGDSVLIGGSFCSQSGIYTDTSTAPGFCKKITVTFLNTLLIYDSLTVNLCPGDSIVAGNKVYYSAGSYLDTLIAASGCDSLLYLSITLLPLSVDSINLWVCKGDSVAVGVHYYSLPGIYSDTIFSSPPCKKLQVTQLDVIFNNDSISAIICEGDSFSVGNSFYLNEGTYADTLISVAGCDSIIVLQLSWSAPLVDSVSVSICKGDSVIVGNSIYFNSGIYTDTIFVPGFCNKIQITELDVNTYSDSLYANICEGDSFSVGNSFYFSEGTYTDTLNNILGCDSIIVLQLSWTVLNIDSASISICNDDSILVGNNYYSDEGIYTDTITITGACKKIQITTLIVHPIVDSIQTSICPGDSVSVGNHFYYNAGTYIDTLTSSYGCDSMVVSEITLNPILTDSVFVSICSGNSYTAGSNTYTDSGVFTDTLSLPGGCNRIQITTLVVNSIVNSSNAIICTGDSFSLGNNYYTLPGIYQDTLTTALGCDSIIILTLDIRGGAANLTASLCEGDSLLFGNSYIFSDGIYTDTLTGMCDSIIQLTVTVQSSATITILASDASVVSGTQVSLRSSLFSASSYNWTGNTIFSSPNNNTTTAVIDSSTWIFLTADVNGCPAYDSIYIQVLSEETDTCEFTAIYIPNAFTPNNDGKNDLFEIITTNIEIDRLLIFSRWGEPIFSTNSISGKWDGNFKDGSCKSDVYYYTLEYRKCSSKRITTTNGSILLLR